MMYSAYERPTRHCLLLAFTLLRNSTRREQPCCDLYTHISYVLRIGVVMYRIVRQVLVPNLVERLAAKRWSTDVRKSSSVMCTGSGLQPRASIKVTMDFHFCMM